MQVSPRPVILGFLAAAIAVVCVHQVIVLGLNYTGIIKRSAWSMEPHGPFGVPTILNAVFWGGLWGSLLVIVYDKLPGSASWIKGLIFGWLIFVFSNNFLVPLIKGQPLFYGGDLNQMLAGFLILSGFGAATAAIYTALEKRV